MTLFRQESLDHKRRKLHGEVILVQPDDRRLFRRHTRHSRLSPQR